MTFIRHRFEKNAAQATSQPLQAVSSFCHKKMFSADYKIQ